MSKLKFYIADTGVHQFSFLTGDQKYLLDNKLDYVVFTGGADVSPHLYNENTHPKTRSSTFRDTKDIKVYNKVKSKRVLKVGICRGAQLLSVLSGGKLVQHVNNHTFNVDTILTPDGEYKISSDHHQMMYPFEVEDHVIIAKSKKPLSTTYEDGNGNQMEMLDGIEPEIVYYPNTHSLCIQGHPEWSSNLTNDEVERIQEYVNNIIEHYVNKNK